MTSSDSFAESRYAIGRLLAEFEDPALERAFQSDRYAIDKRNALIGAVSIAIIWAFSIGLDFVMLHSHPNIAWRLLPIRFVGIAMCALGAGIVVRSSDPKTLAYGFLAAIGVLGSSYAYIVAQYASALNVTQNGAVYIVSGILIVGFAPIALRYSLSGVIALALSALAMQVFVLDTESLATFLFAFSETVFISIAAYFSNLLQKTRRREYAGIQQLGATNRRLQSEADTRIRIEDELRDHQENLEALVHKRTEELRNSESQLHTARKMESVGQLAGGIAHDFSNLLVVILGCSDMALENPNDVKQIQPLLEEIRDAASRASTLTRQLLAFSSRQIMEPQAVDMKQLIQGLEKMMKRLMPANIQLAFSMTGSARTVMADPGQLEQAIVNLVVNSRDAMPKGGEIHVSVADVQVDESLLRANAAAKLGHHVVVEVSDGGTGIDPDIQEQIFEPFFTTKSTGLGTGLGLSVVFGIVKQLGGFIDVHSEPGRGSQFRMYFPSTEQMPAIEPSDEPATTLHGSETILLAEDDSQVRRLAERVLDKAGYTVQVAADGEAALALYREQSQNFDLVILDVLMPSMGGEEAFEAIRKLDSQIPILFCSGYSDGGIHTDFLLKEGLVLLRKPYRPEDLLRIVRGVLDR